MITMPVRYSRVSPGDFVDDLFCSSKFCDELRTVAWRVSTIGLTYAAVNDFIPRFHDDSEYIPPEIRSRSFVGILKDMSDCDEHPSHPFHYRYPIETSKGFIGAQTGSKLKREGLRVEHDSPILSQTLNLLDAAAFCKIQGSNILDNVIAPMLDLQPFIPTKTSGSIVRARSNARLRLTELLI